MTVLFSQRDPYSGTKFFILRRELDCLGGSNPIMTTSSAGSSTCLACIVNMFLSFSRLRSNWVATTSAISQKFSTKQYKLINRNDLIQPPNNNSCLIQRFYPHKHQAFSCYVPMMNHSVNTAIGTPVVFPPNAPTTLLSEDPPSLLPSGPNYLKAIQPAGTLGWHQ